MEPNTEYAEALLSAGFKLCLLQPNTKQPVGLRWNKELVTTPLPGAVGYGFPLAVNKRISLDPDEYDLAKTGMAALGFDLEGVMAQGVRTLSTRPGSGGRSMFADPGGVRWIRFVVKVPDWDDDGALKPVTVLEIRAHSENLQDCVPGLVYFGKHGEGPYTQTYANGRTFLDAVPLPQDFMGWWRRISTDHDFLMQQQRAFAQACGYEPQFSYCDIAPGAPLPFASGCRMSFNAEHAVEDILAEHGYENCGHKRWRPASGTGSPGVRPIPGKTDLWRSDHGSDPLNGTFDAWTAHVILEHEGNLEQAEHAELLRRANFKDEEPAATKEGEFIPKSQVSFAELYASPKVAKPKMLVENMITGGLIIVASPPKTGKSRLLTQLVMSLDTGIPLMGKLSVAQCVVIYYAAEDSMADIQERLLAIGIEPTGASIIKLDMPANPAALEEDLERHKATVAVLDTMAHFAPISSGKANAYDYDTAVYKPLKGVCDRRKATIFCVTHTNKPGPKTAEDPFMTIMGSIGKQGMASGMMVLHRVRVPKGQPKRVQVFVRARSMADGEFILEEDESGVMWRLVEEETREGKSHIATAILDFLRLHGPSRAQVIIAALGESQSSVYYNLGVLVELGKLRPERQTYYLTDVERVG